MLGLLLFAAAASCHPLQNDKITGRDLAAASPLFGSVEPDAAIGYAPAPGHTRVMRPDELRRWLPAATPPIELTQVCFEWVLEAVSKERMLQAMKSALANDEAEITIIEASEYGAPKGDLVFPMSGLPTATANGPVLWRGHVRYAGTRKFNVWARVEIAIPYTRVVAVEEIKAGDVIKAEQLRLIQGKGAPVPGKTFSRIEDVSGRTARNRIAPDTPVLVSTLGAARDITKGDLVRVDVRSGLARLSLQARAESNGAAGDTISVRNPTSGKTFVARVEGPGHVSVNASFQGDQ